MSNSQLIDEIQQLLVEQFQDIYLSSIVLGDLEEPKYNNFIDFNFVESFEGHYILLKYLRRSNSNLDCKIFPRKGSIRKIISSKILNSIYQYEKDIYTLADVNDFRILSAATFRTGIYVASKLKLTLNHKGSLELLRSDRKDDQIQKNISESKATLQVEYAYPGSDIGNKSINEDRMKEIEEDNQKKDREIARLREQLTNISSQSHDTNELLQLREENNNLRDKLSQIAHIAQSPTLGTNVREEGMVNNTETMDDRRENGEIERDSFQHNQKDTPTPTLVDSCAPNENQPLDSQMIKILNWYQQHQDRPDFLEKHTQKVSEIEESFNARRSGLNNAIVLAFASNHSFLIYRDYYMFPRPNSKITNPKLNTFEACFECENFSSGALFEVLKPAIVSRVNDGNDRWQLQERGQLKFL